MKDFTKNKTSCSYYGHAYSSCRNIYSKDTARECYDYQKYSKENKSCKIKEACSICCTSSPITPDIYYKGDTNIKCHSWTPAGNFYFNGDILIPSAFKENSFHTPTGICPGLLSNKLESKDLERTSLSTCCRVRYERDQIRQNKMEDYLKTYVKDFRTEKEEECISLSDLQSHWGRFKVKIRRRLHNPFSSKLAKIWSFLSAGLIVSSIVLFSIEATANDPSKFKTVDESNDSMKISKEKIEFNYFFAGNWSNWDRQKVSIVAETIVVSILLFEFFIRMIVCKSICEFIRKPINAIEFVSFIISAITLVVFSSDVALNSDFYPMIISLVISMKIVRLFRLIRVLQKYPNTSVIWRTLSISSREILLLYTVMLTGMIFFASITFFAEIESDFVISYPLAYWWAITTMTTVGYGDFVPKTNLGRFVASLSAISGIMLVVVIVPVISANFITIFDSHQAGQDLKWKFNVIHCRRRGAVGLNQGSLKLKNGLMETSSNSDVSSNFEEEKNSSDAESSLKSRRSSAESDNCTMSEKGILLQRNSHS